MARWHEAEIDDRKDLGLPPLDGPSDRCGQGSVLHLHWIQQGRLDPPSDDLMLMCEQGEVVAEEQTPFGIKYVVDGLVQAPAGRNIELRTVWISEEPGDRPRR